MAAISYPMTCNVLPLADAERFSTAAYRGMTEWVYHLMLAGWELEGRPRSLPGPWVGATVAEDLLTHGPALWERVRTAFGTWYDKVCTVEEHSIAEHRLWAVLCLRDRRAESILEPWIGQEQPFFLSPPLISAAAQARLIIERGSINDPLEERSHFDLPDLLARTEAVYAEILAGNSVYSPNYYSEAQRRNTTTQ